MVVPMDLGGTNFNASIRLLKYSFPSFISVPHRHLPRLIISFIDSAVTSLIPYHLL